MSATPHVTVDRRGEERVTLSFSSKARYDDKRKAEMIRRRFEKLILMQLDVEEGCMPRSVQQLVSSGRLLVVNGRYMTLEQAAKLREEE